MSEWSIVFSDQVGEWLDVVDVETYEQVMAAVRVLGEDGPHLGRPLVDTVKGSRHKNLKELRPGSTGRSEVRILFAFDPRRQAILILAGDKSGQWDEWYRKNIPFADAYFEEHLRGLGK